MTTTGCAYCDGPAGRVMWRDERCRVLLIEDAPFAGLCRVAWNSHVQELTDLDESGRAHLFRVLAATEESVRALLKPDKINLAALGTQMPHLHWHVIPRFADDSHYPEPIWAAPLRARRDRLLPEEFPVALAGLLAERLGSAAAA